MDKKKRNMEITKKCTRKLKSDEQTHRERARKAERQMQEEDKRN